MRVALSVSLVAWIGFWIALITDQPRALAAPLFLVGIIGQVVLITRSFQERRERADR
jgi:hypothetical protein